MSYGLCWLLVCCQQTCMTYAIAVCTVLDSSWWTEKLSERCRVLFQKYIWEISTSRWFYYKNPETKFASSLLPSLNPATCYKACRQNYWINMITSNFLSVSVHTLITKQAIKICFRLEKLQRERVIEGQLIFFFRIGRKFQVTCLTIWCYRPQKEYQVLSIQKLLRTL